MTFKQYITEQKFEPIKEYFDTFKKKVKGATLKGDTIFIKKGNKTYEVRKTTKGFDLTGYKKEKGEAVGKSIPGLKSDISIDDIIKQIK